MECATQRVNPNVNYRFWVIMMYWYRFTDSNKCTTMEGDVDNGGDCACVGAGGMWEICMPSTQFS